MKLIFATFYALGQISLGLLLHPYQTMQMLVEDRVFVWMSIAPTLLLAFATVVWRVILEPFLYFLICQVAGVCGNDVVATTLAFLTNWFTFYMLYWQVLLMYLLFRFRSVL